MTYQDQTAYIEASGGEMSKCAQKSGHGNFPKWKYHRTPKLLGHVFFFDFREKGKCPTFSANFTS